MRELTIDSLALGQVIVILAGQKSIAITSNNSLNVAIVDIEEEALHLVDRNREFESCLDERLSQGKELGTWNLRSFDRSHVEDYSSTLTVLVFGSVEIPISGFHLQHNFFFTRAALGSLKITTGTKATGKATTFSQWASSFFPRPALALPSSRQKIRKY
jgi:hypothetical protein